MRWSVSIEAAGDRVLTREEIVVLADAVAAGGGIASGIGATRYSAQVLIEALDRATAIERATRDFGRAVETAGLPVCPVVRTDAIGEDE
ncbi:hypothetical protein ILP97_00705 [Amycolatopsis sp. H6(2020)]|nr:hypothetical protein [Amycolatopsis sp. H6(2020)]